MLAVCLFKRPCGHLYEYYTLNVLLFNYILNGNVSWDTDRLHIAISSQCPTSAIPIALTCSISDGFEDWSENQSLV